MEHAVVKLDGTTDRQVSLADTVFSVDFKEPLVHQVVCAYLAGAREGTSSQKNRSVAVVPSPGDRKEPGEPEREPVAVRCGVVVA